MSIAYRNKLPLRMRKPIPPPIENCTFHDEPNPASKLSYKKRFCDSDKKRNWKVKKDNSEEMKKNQTKRPKTRLRTLPARLLSSVLSCGGRHNRLQTQKEKQGHFFDPQMTKNSKVSMPATPYDF